MAAFRLLFSAAAVETFARLPRNDRASLLDKLDFLAAYPNQQADSVLKAKDGTQLEIKTLGRWQFAYSTDFPAKTVIIAWIIRLPRITHRN